MWFDILHGTSWLDDQGACRLDPNEDWGELVPQHTSEPFTPSLLDAFEANRERIRAARDEISDQRYEGACAISHLSAELTTLFAPGGPRGTAAEAVFVPRLPLGEDDGAFIYASDTHNGVLAALVTAQLLFYSVSVVQFAPDGHRREFPTTDPKGASTATVAVLEGLTMLDPTSFRAHGIASLFWALIASQERRALGTYGQAWMLLSGGYKATIAFAPTLDAMLSAWGHARKGPTRHLVVLHGDLQSTRLEAIEVPGAPLAEPDRLRRILNDGRPPPYPKYAWLKETFLTEDPPGHWTPTPAGRGLLNRLPG